jgi:hypothetical protein
MRSVLLLSVVALGCAAPPPYQCSSPVDTSGRGLALCHAANDIPVCDDPGEMAHYVDDAMGGHVLAGGTHAICDGSNQVVCPDRTVMPHCIAQPVAP